MNSYWTETAHPAPPLRALTGDERCDVVVIGGGLTGLATATHLLDRGMDTLVLEARQIGFGASGRNGGSATPRYKPGFAALAKAYGNDTARLLHRRLHEGLDAIEANVDRFGIDCDFRRCGQATAAHSAAALAGLQADAAWLRSVGDGVPRVLERAEAQGLLGLGIYRAAYLDMRGASLHPMNYVRGLAAGLARTGMRIHVDSAASSIDEEGDSVVVRTPFGSSVRARKAILATDAYLETDIAAPPIRRRFLTVSSSIVTTAPLPPEIRRNIVPGGHVVADTFALLNYFQVLPDGRLMFGGRGEVTGREDSPRVYRILEARMRQLFPQLEAVPVSHRWSGLVGLTNDSLPQVAAIGSRCYAAFGYAGRGVVPSHILGRALAELASGRAEEFGPLIRPLPPAIGLHRLKRAGMQIAIAYLGLRDRWEARR